MNQPKIVDYFSEWVATNQDKMSDKKHRLLTSLGDVIGTKIMNDSQCSEWKLSDKKLLHSMLDIVSIQR